MELQTLTNIAPWVHGAHTVELLLNADSKNELSARVKEQGELEKHHALFVDGRKHIVHQESTAFWKLIK